MPGLCCMGQFFSTLREGRIQLGRRPSLIAFAGAFFFKSSNYPVLEANLCPRVRNVVDTHSWSHLLPDHRKGSQKLRPPFWDRLSAVLLVLVRVWESRLPVDGPSDPHTFEGGPRPSPATLPPVVGSRLLSSHRQTSEPATWRMFHRLRLPPQGRVFIYTALWKQLALGEQLHSIFPGIPPMCHGAREDVYHHLKACSWLTGLVPVLDCTCPAVQSASGCVPTGRLCTRSTHSVPRMGTGSVALEGDKGVVAVQVRCVRGTAPDMSAFLRVLHSESSDVVGNASAVPA